MTELISTYSAPPGPHLWGVILRTGRFDAMLQFYADALGLPIQRAPFLLGGRLVVLLGSGGAVIEIREVRQTEPAETPEPSAPRLSIRVEHLDQARLAAHGAALVDRPRVPDTGRADQDAIAHVRDPDGRLVQLRWPQPDAAAIRRPRCRPSLHPSGENGRSS